MVNIQTNNVSMDHAKYPHHPLLNDVNKYGYPALILVNNNNIIKLCGN